jgi:zeta-carotene desaturase
VILGAGLAGLAAGMTLADAGFAVTVLERKSIPGGRASSFFAQDSGEEVDNCQHVLMGCCTNLQDFYRRAGVEERIRWHHRLSFLEPNGRISVLHASRLPAPFHLLPSFFRARFLGPSDKRAVASALMRMLRPAQARLEGMTALAWLQEQRQTTPAIERFWRVVLVSALNEELERCSAAYARQIFRLGFLANRRAYEMGIPAVPLSDLYDPCVRRIQAAGGEVHFRQVARALELDPAGAVRGVRVNDGEPVPADYVVSALSFEAVPGLLPGAWAEHPHFQGCARLEPSPISAVHLWYDREVTAMDHAVLLDRPVQWMFNKTRNYSRENGSSYLGCVVSASREWLSWPRGRIVETTEQEIRAAFPAAAPATLLRSAVIKEARATFSASPGVDALRPAPATPIPRFYLAGDWVRTGWPPTMEGAVRSGYQAAEQILAAEGRPQRFLLPELAWESMVGSA